MDRFSIHKALYVLYGTEMPGSSHRPPPEVSLRLRIVTSVIGGLCATLGCLVLVGWLMHLPALIQLRTEEPPIPYNAAICFVLAGLALGAWAFGRIPRATLALGGFVFVLGGLTLAEYLFNADLGIDQALFHTYLAPGIAPPGRMSPVCTLSFTLAGLAVLLLTLRSGSRWRAAIAASASSLVISFCLTAIAGYTFGIPGSQLTRVAAQTAGGLTLLGIGILVIAWKISLRSGERTPRWLPAPLALAILTGSLVLYLALQGRQDEDASRTVKYGAESASNQISSHIESRIRVFVHMAQLWEFYGPPTQALFEDDAYDYLHHSPDVQALEWIDSSYHTRWTVPAPRSSDNLNPDLSLDPRRRAALDQAEREHQPVITRLVTIPSGGLGFVVYVPLIVDGKPYGFIAASFSGHSSLLRYLPSLIAAGESIEIYDGGQLFFARDTVAGAPRLALVHQNIELPGITWRMLIWPAPELAARLNPPLPGVVLSAGLICSLLLGSVCFFAQRSSRQAAETRRANTLLQSALDTVKTLEGLLPICSSCKRVRDDTGYWSQIDTYIGAHTNASLSHGYCPECAASAFREFGFEVPPEVQALVAAGNFE